MLIQLLANGLVSGCLYALVALGFALIYNTTQIFHLAHGAIYTAAAYLLYLFGILLKWPFYLAILFALTGTSLLGFLMNYTVYEPLRKKKASLLVALLSSIGVYTVVINVIAMLFGNETKILRPGIEKTYQFGNVILTRIQLAEVVVFLILFLLIMWLIRGTTWGKQIRAVRDNPQLAEVMGIRLQRIYGSVFFVGSGLAGMAAFLAAMDVGMDPHVGLPMLLTAAVAMIIGGVGTFGGAVLGAFLIAVLQSLIIWQVSARWVDAVTFSLLILFLLFRPEGLLGQRKRVEEAMA